MTDRPKTPPPVPTAEAAVRLQAFARQKRALARHLREDRGDPVGARLAELDAEQIERRAADGLEPLMHTTGPLRPGLGGELVAGTAENQAKAGGALIDTVRTRPDMLVADASVKRMELLDGARALTLGVDLAETIQARNSAERALAHQLAAAHALAMRLMQRAQDFTDQSAPAARGYGDAQREQMANVEAARCAGAAARLMEAFQRGMLTLDRLRNGGQAVVAGAVAPEGVRHRRGERSD